MTSTLATPFSQFANEVRREVDAALDCCTRYDSDCPPNLQNAIRHSLLAPCKRLRPMLVLMAVEACGYDRERGLPAACAVEMVHTYSLIHDDLPAMDDDDLRRGRPSCHAAFGEATAILAGDALLAQAFEVLARDTEPPEVAARCCAELAQAAGASALVGGQTDDLAAEHQSLSIDDLERIHRRKTGALFRASLRLGGIVGHADGEELSSLDLYGRKMGLAFQIIDDLLDLKGDETVLGKRTGKDSDRGKLTFPGLLGAKESRLRAEQLVSEACRAVGDFGPRGEHLVSLAQYVLERNE